MRTPARNRARLVVAPRPRGAGRDHVREVGPHSARVASVSLCPTSPLFVIARVPSFPTVEPDPARRRRGGRRGCCRRGEGVAGGGPRRVGAGVSVNGRIQR